MKIVRERKTATSARNLALEVAGSKMQGRGQWRDKRPAGVDGSIAVHDASALSTPGNVKHIHASRDASHALPETALVRLWARGNEAPVP